MAPGGSVLDSIVITADTTVKAAPSVAYGSGVYLVSWTDNRVEFPDIYCARVLPNGTVLDVGGFPLYSDSAYQAGSIVSFDGTNFLVAWSSYEGSLFSLKGARVTPGGVVLDSPPIMVSQGSSSKFGPGLAFDGANYMLQWDDSRLNPPEYDQWAARVTPQGAVIDTNGIPVDTSLGNQYHKSLGFLDHLYLSCWSDFSTGEADLYRRRISPEGEWIDTVAIPLCTATGHQETPCVFQDDEKFIVAWQDARNGITNTDLYAAFVDSASTGIGEDVGDGRIHSQYTLLVNPNPFIKKANISLEVANTENGSELIELGIFDASGRLIRQFIIPNSSFSVIFSWDGRDEHGEEVAPGVYFVVLKDSLISVTEKVLKIR